MHCQSRTNLHVNISSEHNNIFSNYYITTQDEKKRSIIFNQLAMMHASKPSNMDRIFLLTKCHITILCPLVQHVATTCHATILFLLHDKLKDDVAWLLVLGLLEQNKPRVTTIYFSLFRSKNTLRSAVLYYDLCMVGHVDIQVQCTINREMENKLSHIVAWSIQQNVSVDGSDLSGKFKSMLGKSDYTVDFQLHIPSWSVCLRALQMLTWS